MSSKFFSVSNPQTTVTVVEDKGNFYELSDGNMIKKDTFMQKYQPVLDEVKQYYQIDFPTYAVAMYHPVTTEVDTIEDKAHQFVEALIESGRNYVVIYPNNDLGSKHILKAYNKLRNNPRIKIFPSVRFEYFLTLLKNSMFIIGNSSAGVREAPYYGVPSINIGTRQANRVFAETISNIQGEKQIILSEIKRVLRLKKGPAQNLFGGGNSCDLFLESLSNAEVWTISHQKQFQTNE